MDTKLYMLFVLFMTLFISNVFSIEISNCQEITSPGTYVLNSSIFDYNNQVCFKITSSDVVLDCNNKYIQAKNQNMSVGIWIYGSSLQNITVRNCYLDNWSFGIFIRNSKNVKLENVRIYNSCCDGVLIDSSENISVLNSEFFKNDWNIYVFNSTNVIMDEISVNRGNYGVFFDNSSSNILKNSNIDRTNKAITFCVSCFGNNITGVSLFSNDYGIYVLESSNNVIYNNWFNNSINAYVNGSGSNNWSVNPRPGSNILGGNEIGGNFWADFSPTCVDNDLDGFCDDPYIINSNNIDYYPLSTAQNFTIDLEKNTITIPAGGRGNIGVNISLISGNPSSVTLSCENTPNGTTCKFTPPSCVPTCNSTLEIKVSFDAIPGEYIVYIVGEGGEIRKKALNLKITEVGVGSSIDISQYARIISKRSYNLTKLIFYVEYSDLFGIKIGEYGTVFLGSKVADVSCTGTECTITSIKKFKVNKTKIKIVKLDDNIIVFSNNKEILRKTGNLSGYLEIFCDDCKITPIAITESYQG